VPPPEKIGELEVDQLDVALTDFFLEGFNRGKDRITSFLTISYAAAAPRAVCSDGGYCRMLTRLRGFNIFDVEGAFK
jgi:hypothetical protein